MLTSASRNISARASLQRFIKRGVMYENGMNYDKRWQGQFKYAYYSEPLDTDATKVRKPEDSPSYDGHMGSFSRNNERRVLQNYRVMMERGHRLLDPFNLFFLPAWIFTAAQFFPLGLGFKMMTAIPAFMLWTRIRNKTRDPELQETYLLDMIHSNPVIAKYFSVETTQVLDFHADFIPGFPYNEEMPEFKQAFFSLLIRVLQY